MITWALIVVLGAFAAWNGYQYWQRNQAAQAAVMYEEVERSVQSGDAARIDRALADMKERFFPAGDKWREMVWARADQTIGWALKGLSW